MYDHGHLEGGRLGLAEKFKMPFFGDIENSFHEVTHIGLKPHQFFFLFKISQQMQLLETSKFAAKMGHGWQTVWVMAKIFLSNLHRHMIYKC